MASAFVDLPLDVLFLIFEETRATPSIVIIAHGAARSDPPLENLARSCRTFRMQIDTWCRRLRVRIFEPSVTTFQFQYRIQNGANRARAWAPPHTQMQQDPHGVWPDRFAVWQEVMDRAGTDVADAVNDGVHGVLASNFPRVMIAAEHQALRRFCYNLIWMGPDGVQLY
jgi:hypothetical protein